MSLTIESAALSGFSHVLRNVVLPEIVKYINSSRGINISCEELSKCLLLPQAQSTPSLQQHPQVPTMPMHVGMVPNQPLPSMGFPGNIPSNIMQNVPQAAPKSKGKTKAGNAPQIDDNMRCQYIFSRGDQKGSRCSNQIEPGSPLCRVCSTKKTALNQIQNNKGTGGGVAPGANQMLGSNPTNNGLPKFQPQMPQKQQPQILLHDLHNGFYWDEVNDLIFKPTQIGEGTGGFICVGVPDASKKQVLELTTDAIAKCIKYGLDYVKPTNDITKQNGFTVGVSNVHSQLPGFPTQNTNNGPSFPGQFQQNNSFNTQPSQNGLPNFPGQNVNTAPNFPSQSIQNSNGLPNFPGQLATNVLPGFNGQSVQNSLPGFPGQNSQTPNILPGFHSQNNVNIPTASVQLPQNNMLPNMLNQFPNVNNQGSHNQLPIIPQQGFNTLSDNPNGVSALEYGKSSTENSRADDPIEDEGEEEEDDDENNE